MFRPQGTLLQKERGSNQGLLIFGGAPLPPRPPQNGSCLFCPISWVKVRRKFRLLGICPLRVKQGGFSFKFTEILPGGNFQSHLFQRNWHLGLGFLFSYVVSSERTGIWNCILTWPGSHSLNPSLKWELGKSLQVWKCFTEEDQDFAHRILVVKTTASFKCKIFKLSNLL